MSLTDGKCYEVCNYCGPEITVRRFKNKISCYVNIPAKEMRIVCGGQVLKDFPTFSQYGIKNDANFFLFRRSIHRSKDSGSLRSLRYYRRCSRRGDDEPSCVSPEYANIKKISNPLSRVGKPLKKRLIMGKSTKFLRL